MPAHYIYVYVCAYMIYRYCVHACSLYLCTCMCLYVCLFLGIACMPAHYIYIYVCAYMFVYL